MRVYEANVQMNINKKFSASVPIPIKKDQPTSNYFQLKQRTRNFLKPNVSKTFSLVINTVSANYDIFALKRET